MHYIVNLRNPISISFLFLGLGLDLKHNITYEVVYDIGFVYRFKKENILQ